LPPPFGKGGKIQTFAHGYKTKTKKGEKNKMAVAASITKDMIVTDILAIDPEIANFFMNLGMRCFACPSSRGKTLEMACGQHGADADELVKVINGYLEKKDP
jgi:hybrid cluster-associated redox disulfide protein